MNEAIPQALERHRRSLAGAALLAALGLVLLLRALGLAHGGSSPAALAGAAGGRGAALPAAARGTVSGAIGASDRGYWVSGAAGGLLASNRAQHLRVRFDRSGASVRAGSLHVGLSLRALGAGGASRALDSVAPTANANRVNYAHGGVSEWYRNGPLGLEQGFTVAHAPSSGSQTLLTLALGLSGNARARLERGATAVVLRHAGSPTLRYGELRAADASGRQLPARLALSGDQLLVRVDTSGARYPIAIDPLIAQGETLAGEGESASGQFGYSVAISADGGTALVGGPADETGLGAAWVFVRSGTGWSEQGPKLTAGESGGAACGFEAGEEGEECGFGRSVALSANGDTALIGAPRGLGHEGGAWVFTRSSATSQWTRGAELVGNGTELGRGRFGRSVAISADGRTALVGSPADQAGHGAAFVFAESGGAWTQAAKLTAPSEIGEGYFGRSVALSAGGTTALVGVPGDGHYIGAAWVFTRTESSWSAQQELSGGGETGEARFGFSLALSGEGNTALVGGRTDSGGAGAAWVFTRTEGAWSQQGAKLMPSDEVEGGEFGFSTALSANGDTALIGAPRDNGHLGAAWVFERSSGSWAQQESKFAIEAEPSLIWFGTGVALSAAGGNGLVGGPKDNAKLGGAWQLQGINVPPPVVTSVSPSSGSTAGGTAVTIAGSGFQTGATVTIGNEAAAVQVVSETEIAATTTATATGSYEVVVADANGVSSGGPSFTYKAPETLTPLTTTPTTPQTSSTGSGGVLSTTSSAPPAPVLGVTGNLAPVSGTVFIRLPGSGAFVPLNGVLQVPFGTVVDARHGRVSVTTAGPHGTQTMTFYEGEFVLTQSHNARVTATLFGGSYNSCPTARERAHRASASSKHSSGKHVVRKLWASGHGSFSTKGTYATGAVLGTTWLTEDRCDGTLILVASDRVAVTNLVSHRHVTVKAGHRYIAKAR